MYVPEEEGDYEIFVKYDDVDIPDSPFKVSVSSRGYDYHRG